MSMDIFWSQSQKALFGASGRFDAWKLTWQAEALPGDAEKIAPLDALVKLAANGGMRRVPVGVIGPKIATDEQRVIAEKVGAELAKLGLQMLCGGKNGVMEAACKGHAEAGGMPIGLLPDEEWTPANDYCTVPIPTGIGPARNAIIARGCQVLIAIGGGHGTVSEMALGLHFDRPVFALAGAPSVEGATVCETAEQALEGMAAHLLRQ